MSEHPNRHRISRLLLASFGSATAEDIRKERHVNERLISAIYEAQARQRECEALVRTAEIAFGQASPEQKDAVEAQLLGRKTDLQTANNTCNAASRGQQAHEKKLEQMEADFAQDELLMFIDKRLIKGRYARNPRNLADAMGGLPYTRGVHFMGAWQSYARCSKLPCPPHFRFELFETIQSIWKRSQKSKLAAAEFFYQEIMALPNTVKTVDQTNIAVEDKAENAVRSYLLNNWPIWRLAIEKSLEYQGDQERIPFFICVNFTKVQSDPKTSVYLVLGTTEKTRD